MSLIRQPVIHSFKNGILSNDGLADRTVRSPRHLIRSAYCNIRNNGGSLEVYKAAGRTTSTG